MSQSVGTSHTFAMHRGQRKPSLFISEWHAQRLGGDESGRRVGKPIIIRSAAGFAPPPPPARATARWAGGGTSSNSRSLKCPSFIATPNWPVQFMRVKNPAPSHRPTACFVTHIPTYLHFSRQGDHGYSNFVPHASIERVVNVSRITGRQRAKDDENFARRMSGEVTVALKIQKEANSESCSPHAAPPHFNSILQARFASRFKFCTITE